MPVRTRRSSLPGSGGNESPALLSTRELLAAPRHTVCKVPLNTLSQLRYCAQPLAHGPLSPPMAPRQESLILTPGAHLQKADPPPFLAQWVLAGCLRTPYQKVASEGQTNHLGLRVCHDQNPTWRQNYIPRFLPHLDKDQSPRGNAKDHQPLPRASILGSEFIPA